MNRCRADMATPSTPSTAVYAALTALVALLFILTACAGSPSRQQADPSVIFKEVAYDQAAGIRVLADSETGAEYLQGPDGSLVPRLWPDGCIVGYDEETREVY